jgi:hypothetical protein
MANYVGDMSSRDNGQRNPSGLSAAERNVIGNYVTKSRDNGPTSSSKVALNSEVSALMRAGLTESTAKELIGNLKGVRENPGVSTLALALPNPGGVGVRPPNLDEIRRNGMEDKMGKRKLTAAQKAALARGRNALAAMRAGHHHRDNITKSNFAKLQGQGEAFTLDTSFDILAPRKKKLAGKTYADLIRDRIAAAEQKGGNAIIESRVANKYTKDASGKTVLKVDENGNVITFNRDTRYAKAKKVVANPQDYVLVTKRRLKVEPLTEDSDTVRTGPKKEKSAADTAHIRTMIRGIKGEIAKIGKMPDKTKLKQSGLSDRKIESIIASAEKTAKKAAEGSLKSLNNMEARIKKLEAAAAAADGTLIPAAYKADYQPKKRTARSAEAVAKSEADRAQRKELSKLFTQARKLGVPVADLFIPSTIAALKDRPEFKIGEKRALLEQVQAEISSLQAAAAQRDNGYHMDRDNITAKSVLYGVGSFVGGSLAGVVITNGVHNLSDRFGLSAKTADYVTKGVGALLAVDLFLSMRDNRGHLFHRIEDRGVRIGLAAGLILPMVARTFVGDMLNKYEFGRKINTFLAPEKAKAAAALPAPASGFGSIYDLAFDEVELPTSGVGVDVSEAVAGMGRYVTGTQGVGRYVTGAEAMGRYVTGTSGLGVNVSEAVAGMGVNVSEALAGQTPSFRTGGTVFRDGLRGLGADEAFDILSELESFEDLSDDDQYLEGIGQLSRSEKAMYASSGQADAIRAALAKGGREVAITFLRPSNVRPNTFIAVVSRPGVESAKQALSQMTQVPSSLPVPPTTLPNAIMTRGVFGKPLFPVTI